MFRNQQRISVVVLCLVAGRCSDAVSNETASDSKPIEGLWCGTWGGSERDGVIFQPVFAELFIKADQVELCGFRDVDRLTGTVHVDASAKRMQITPTAEEGEATPKARHYAYQIDGDQLTLVDGDKFPITLQKVHVVQDPLANVQIELVAASEINDAGDLLVTEFTVLQAGRTDTSFFMPVNRLLKTKQAMVALVQESGCRRVTVDEARRRIREPTPVAVMYRDVDRRSPQQLHKLWRDTGSPKTDSEAVWRTLSRILRPGTLVFSLAQENVPHP